MNAETGSYAKTSGLRDKKGDVEDISRGQRNKTDESKARMVLPDSSSSFRTGLWSSLEPLNYLASSGAYRRWTGLLVNKSDLEPRIRKADFRQQERTKRTGKRRPPVSSSTLN